MRVAGEDERVDALIDVLADARRDVLAGPYEREPNAEPRASDARPEVRADPVALLAQHALAFLALTVGLAHVLLHHALEVLRHLGDHRFSRGARLLVGFAHTDEQADAEAQRAPEPCRAFAHVGDTLTHHVDRLAPEQVDVGFFRADRFRRIGSAAEVPRRAWLLIRLREDVALLYLVVRAFMAPRFRLGPCAAHHLHELLRADVALVVLREVTVGRQLVREAARHDVDQHAAVRELVERVRHLRRDRRRDEPGPHCDEELELFRARRDERGRDPGVLARRPDGHQREDETRVLGRARDPHQVIGRRLARRRTDDFRITHGGQKPAEIYAHVSAPSHSVCRRANPSVIVGAPPLLWYDRATLAARRRPMLRTRSLRLATT